MSSKFYARQNPKLFPVALYTQSATQQGIPLGSKWKLADGREFVYCKIAASGGPTGPGYLVQAEAIDAQQCACAVAAAAAIGATYIDITNGADTHDANTYKDGYIHVDDDAGEGQLLKIATHEALTSGGTSRFYLQDSVRVALTTSTTVTVMKSPFMDVILCPANTPTGAVIGVCPITPTASYYTWIQYKGLASVLIDNSTTLIVGVPVQAYGDVAGACQVMTENEEIPIIGVAQWIGATNNERAGIMLSIPWV